MVITSHPPCPVDTGPVYLSALAAGFSQREYRIAAQETFIGRDGQCCGLVNAGPTVSRCHARLIRQEGRRFSLQDLDSTNGLYVNGQRIVGETLLREGDLIGLGMPAPHLRFQHQSSREPRRYSLPAKTQWVVGRDPECDLSLAGEPTVSGRHALLCNENGRLVLVDDQSLNGTWINGRARRRALLAAADTVLIGSMRFRFQLRDDGVLSVEQQECGQSVDLECVALTRRAKPSSAQGRILLDQMCLHIAAGEFVGIIGPSGAGKTTLLRTLSGMMPPDEGWVLCNETVLDPSSPLFRNTIGYVPQDDILHQELSVEASLDYMARLRLSPDLSPAQRQAIVDGTVETLGLQQVRRLPIGQLSGGQRKRVSLGAELLVRPGLLFLDEPTSGLDPATEQQLMRHFRAMADQGTTVVMTTHLLAHVDLLDKIAICAQGNLVFFGTPREALAFFGVPDAPLADPTRIFARLAGEGHAGSPEEQLACARQFAEQFRRSSFFQAHIYSRFSATARTLFGGEDDGRRPAPVIFSKRRWARVWQALPNGSPMAVLRSWAILSRRHLQIRLGSLKKIVLYLLVPVVLALVTLSQPMPGIPDDALVQARKTEITEAVSRGGAAFERRLGLLLGGEEPGAFRSGSERLYALRYEGAAHLPIPMGSLLMMVMAAVFCGTLMACLEISGEISIYRRERQSYLRIFPYIASKLPCCFFLTALQCLVFLAICLLSPVLRQVELSSLWLGMVAISWSSVGLGLLLSAADPSGGRFSVMAAVAAVLPQLLLSGGIGPEFFRSMSTIQRVLADLLPARWGLEMICTAVYGSLAGEGVRWIPAFIRDGIGFDFGTGVDYNSGLILLGQFLCWLFLCAGILHYRDHRGW
ncbi:MAG: FHA domain-containing protein [Desulfobulbus sp.]